MTVAGSGGGAASAAARPRRPGPGPARPPAGSPRHPGPLGHRAAQPLDRVRWRSHQATSSAVRYDRARRYRARMPVGWGLMTSPPPDVAAAAGPRPGAAANLRAVDLPGWQAEPAACPAMESPAIACRSGSRCVPVVLADDQQRQVPGRGEVDEPHTSAGKARRRRRTRPPPAARPGRIGRGAAPSQPDLGPDDAVRPEATPSQPGACDRAASREPVRLRTARPS